MYEGLSEFPRKWGISRQHMLCKTSPAPESSWNKISLLGPRVGRLWSLHQCSPLGLAYVWGTCSMFKRKEFDHHNCNLGKSGLSLLRKRYWLPLGPQEDSGAIAGIQTSMCVQFLCLLNPACPALKCDNNGADELMFSLSDPFNDQSILRISREREVERNRSILKGNPGLYSNRMCEELHTKLM